VRLGDDRVEQTIMVRARRSEQLSGEMRARRLSTLIRLDRAASRSATSISQPPPHGRPDMFSQYTSDYKSRVSLLQR
jgi:hypothetical protein